VGNNHLGAKKPHKSPAHSLRGADYEGLVKLLENGQPSIGLFADEAV